LVAHVLWLLGQDDQWLRPRAAAMPVALAAGALVDVVDAGAGKWVDGAATTAVELSTSHEAAGLVGHWAGRLQGATRSGSLTVMHAINALAPDLWDAVGADLATQGEASNVPRPIRRWLPPRRRPNEATARQVRDQLREVIEGTRSPTPRDEGVLAVASCAGVVEHIMSSTAFTDHAALAPTRALLEGSRLVARLTPAVPYLVSLGPTIGLPTGTGVPGAGSGGQ
jgi:hypothetical protein